MIRPFFPTVFPGRGSIELFRKGDRFLQRVNPKRSKIPLRGMRHSPFSGDQPLKLPPDKQKNLRLPGGSFVYEFQRDDLRGL